MAALQTSAAVLLSSQSPRPSRGSLGKGSVVAMRKKFLSCNIIYSCHVILVKCFLTAMEFYLEEYI